MEQTRRVVYGGMVHPDGRNLLRKGEQWTNTGEGVLLSPAYSTPSCGTADEVFVPSGATIQCLRTGDNYSFAVYAIWE